MSLHSLNEVRSLIDPLKQFQVKFTISEFPALKLAREQQKLTSGDTVRADKLELRCTSFSYPSTKIAQTETVIAGFRRKLASIQNKSGVWTCKITEDQNGAVMNTIQSWCDLIHNPFTGTRLPSTLYVTTCVVEIEKVDGNKARTIFLKGFYPIEYSVKEIDASSSNPVEIEVKFNYDWWTETTTGIAALGL